MAMTLSSKKQVAGSFSRASGTTCILFNVNLGDYSLKAQAKPLLPDVE